VLDASESMGIGFGPGTRYSVLAKVLSNLVDAYQSRIRFGLAQFPGPDALCLANQSRGAALGLL
jgi:Mg-chelatase subunit ChlD